MPQIARTKLTLLSWTLIFSLLVTASMRAASYSYVDLVGRLTSLEHLAELPVAGETSAEWTSRDRTSVYNSGSGQYVNWGANDDFAGNLGTQPDGGTILAQMNGPGCLWRIWSGQVGTGHVKIFLDGSTS